MAVGDKKPVVMEEDMAVPGGIATLGTDGKLASEQIPGLEALGAIEYINSLPFTRKNLLDNWYFADPINQRRQTEYVGAGYTIDRWYCPESTAVTLTDNGIKLTTLGSGSVDGYFEYRQLPTDVLPGKLTFSALYSNIDQAAEPALRVVLFTDSGVILDTTPTTAPDNVLLSWTVDLSAYDLSAVSMIGWRLNNRVGGSSVTVKATKLELGTTQTLARQDENGNWVLNDPPPDKATELAKCQRYYWKRHFLKYETICQYYANEAWVTAMIGTGAPMRANPAPQLSGEIGMIGVGQATDLSVITTGSVVGSTANLGFSTTVTTNGAGYLYCTSETGCDIELDANL